MSLNKIGSIEYVLFYEIFNEATVVAAIFQRKKIARYCVERKDDLHETHLQTKNPPKQTKIICER